MNLKKKLVISIAVTVFLLVGTWIFAGCGANDQDVYISTGAYRVEVYTYNGYHPMSVTKTETPDGYQVVIDISTNG